jgi:formate dehydrogenase major subunit
MVTLYVDDLAVSVEKGSTILDAARKLGIYIPTLCYHPDLTTFGGCRVCMVEANGKLVTACRAPVEEGMVVRTDSSAARQVQRTVVELTLSNHNGDCLTCVKDSRCKLQEVANYVGITPERMAMLRSAVPEVEVDESNPFFKLDRTRCILCGICVRTCQEINGVAAIDFGFRGHKTTVVTIGNKGLAESRCESCGECLERCPTGALARKDYEQPSREVKSVCPYCGVGCGIYLGVRGDRVVSVRGDKDSPVNSGQLCVKGRFGYHFINHPDRLTAPLIKRDGVFVEASWDEALDLVAARFLETAKHYGPDALAGISSARCTTEENYLFQKLLRFLGTNNIDHCARL